MVDVKRTQRLVDGRTLSADCTSFYEGRKKTHTPKLNSKSTYSKLLAKKKTKKNGFLFGVLLVCIGNFSGGFSHCFSTSGVVFGFGLQIRGALAAATNWCKGGLTAVT